MREVFSLCVLGRDPFDWSLARRDRKTFQVIRVIYDFIEFVLREQVQHTQFTMIEHGILHTSVSLRAENVVFVLNLN